jgi:hypothetical protein
MARHTADVRVGPRTYRFRFLRSSWGLAVDLTAVIVAGSSDVLGAPEVVDGVRLDLSSTAAIVDDRAEVVAALARCAPALLSVLPQPITFVVEALEYAPTDYQPQAAYCAVLGWLRESLGLDLPMPEITFDEASRRYVVAGR